MAVIDRILKANDNFEEKIIQRVITTVGGESEVCIQHLKLMLSLKPDQSTLLLYFLHEYVLEGHITIKKIEQNFGREVAQMIAQINTVFQLPVSKNTDPEVIRKLFLTLAKDVRVVTVLLVNKVAELEHAKQDKKPHLVELCHSAMEIYIPIATRMGMYEIKTRMEDVCFEVLYPEDFVRITDELKQYEEMSNKVIGQGTQSLNVLLEASGIKAEISGRVKHPYSVYKKMTRKQKQSVSEIFDIFALRIILDSDDSKSNEEDVSQCYAVLGLIHSRWKPLARRFKDYIAVPKVNGYKSLHTTVLGLTPDVRDEPTEIQIRTRRMHEEAEFGIASHWWYKEGSTGHTVSTAAVESGNTNNRVQSQLEWLQSIADLHKEMEGPTSVDHSLNLFSDDIFVLTPNGDVMDLPKGATPVDFAYSVHTEVGHSCSQAKVNGSIVPLDHELDNGDVVQIVTKKGSTPNRYWLSFTKSHGAQYRIKNWFRSQDKEKNVKMGRELFNKALAKLNKPNLDPSLSILASYDGKEMAFKEREFILECIGNGHYSTKQVLKKIFSPFELLTAKNLQPVKAIKFKTVDQTAIKESKVVISGETDIPISFSSCCTPSLGMPIVGYVGRGHSVRVHSADCEELASLDENRKISVEWADVDGYFVTLELRTIDSPEITSQIWERLKAFETPVKDLSTIEKVSGGVLRQLYIKVKDLDELQDVMTRLENLEGVEEIRKV